jgi:predicted nuclease of predicted toxin-antitoxin system
MKVLLDECLPIDFRHHLPGHEVHTVEWAGLKGLKNGQLLERAEQAGYQVLITVDQGVPRQQNLTARRIAVLIMRTRTNQLEDLLAMADGILAALEGIRPGGAVTVS